MPIGVTNHVAAQGSGSVGAATSAADFTNTSVLYVCTSGYFGAPTPSDSQSNVYTQLTLQTTTNYSATWVCNTPSVSSTMTWTTPGTNYYENIDVVGQSGTDPINPVHLSSSSASNNVQTIQPGSLATAAGESAITFLALYLIPTITTDSGFGPLDQLATSGSMFGVASASNLTPSNPTNPTWSQGYNPAPVLHTHMATFRPAATQPASIQNPDLPPVGAKFPTILRGFTGAVNDGLIGKDQQFGAAGQFKAYDYPNPKGPQYPSHLRTFIDTLHPELVGQDIQFAGPGQWQSYDYPNPRGPRRSVDLLTWAINLNETTTATNPNPLVRIYDFPNPRGPQYPITNRTIAVNLLESGLIPALGTIPHAEYDYPNPRGPQLDYGRFQHKFYYVIDQNVPFSGGIDWPVPRGPIPNIALRTWTVGLLQTAIRPPIIIPFNTYDWPLPVPLRVDPNRYSHIRFIVTDQTPPFHGGIDWPVPKSAVPSVELKTWIGNLLESSLAAAAAKPFGESDFPNPAGARRPIENQGFMLGLNVALLHHDQFFGANGEAPVYDYPNPKGPRRSVDLLTWTDNTLQTTQIANVAIPFAQFSWPIPNGYRPAPDLRTFLHAVDTKLIGKDKLVNTLLQLQQDFPNPRGPRSAVTLHMGSTGLNPNIPPPIIITAPDTNETQIGLGGVHGSYTGGSKIDSGE